MHVQVDATSPLCLERPEVRPNEAKHARRSRCSHTVGVATSVGTG